METDAVNHTMPDPLIKATRHDAVLHLALNRPAKRNAVNDALSPMGASIWQMPMTPERILNALDQG